MARLQEKDSAMLSYVMVSADDIPQAGRFYSAFIPDLGYVLEEDKGALVYSLASTPESANGPGTFYVTPPFDGRSASVGNGSMVAFRAPTQADVRALHAAALAAVDT
jgi:hypothetical protein